MNEIIPASVMVAMSNGETLQFDLYHRVVGVGYLCHCTSIITMSVSATGLTWQSALANAIKDATQILNK